MPTGVRRLYPVRRPPLLPGVMYRLSKKDWNTLSGPEYQLVVERGGITVRKRRPVQEQLNASGAVSAVLLSISVAAIAAMYIIGALIVFQ